jgi:hypothetical protein
MTLITTSLTYYCYKKSRSQLQKRARLNSKEYKEIFDTLQISLTFLTLGPNLRVKSV